jgi:hypothetical protein
VPGLLFWVSDFLKQKIYWNEKKPPIVLVFIVFWTTNRYLYHYMLPENKTPETAKQVQTADLNTEEGEKETGGLQMRSPELVLLASSSTGPQQKPQQEKLKPAPMAVQIKNMIMGKGPRPLSDLPAILRQMDSAYYDELSRFYFLLYPTADRNLGALTRDLLNHFRQDKGSTLWRDILVELSRLESPESYSPNPNAGFVDGNLDHQVKGADGKKQIGLLGTYRVGQQVTMDLGWFDAITKEKISEGANLMMHVYTPSGKIIQRFGPGDKDISFKASEAGVYDVILIENVRREGFEFTKYDIGRAYFLVNSEEGLAKHNVGDVAPVGYEDLKTRMLVQDIAMGGYGVKDQQVGPEYISSSLDNPVRPQWGALGGYQPQTASYTAHGIADNDNLRARWYVALEDKPEIRKQYPELGNATDKSRNRLKVPPGHALFHLGFDHSLSKDFELKTPGQYMLYAEEYTTAAGEAPTGKVARYHHSALSDQQDKARENFRAYQSNVTSRMEQMQPGQEIPLRAAHVNEKGERTQLTMYLGPAQNGGLLLVDATPGAREMEYRGDDIDSLFKDVVSRASSYPKGRLFFEIPKNNHHIKHGMYHISTEGDSDMGALSKATGWASLAAAGAGVVSLFVPGGQVVAPFLFMGSSALGAVSAGTSLADQADNASVDKAGVTLDVLTIASSLIGLGAAGVAARSGGNALLGGTRWGRYVLYTNLGLEGAAGMVLTYDGVAQIKAISEKEGMSPEDKRNAIVRLIATLAVTGGLFVLSAKDLAGLQKRGLSPDADPANPLVPGRNLMQLPPAERIAEFQSLIDRVKARIQTEPKFKVNYTDLEMADTAILGRQLNLSDREIEDFLFVGQRSEASKPQKTLTIDDVRQQMKNWATVVRTRDFPYLFDNREAFTSFKDEIRDILRRYDIPDSNVNIQGSSLRTEAAKDIDMAVFVTKEEFDAIVSKAIKGIETRQNGTDITSQKKRENLIGDVKNQAASGRLNSYYFDRIPGNATTFNQALYQTRRHLNDPDKGVDLSVMLEGANFSVSPLLPFDK